MNQQLEVHEGLRFVQMANAGASSHDRAAHTHARVHMRARTRTHAHARMRTCAHAAHAHKRCAGASLLAAGCNGYVETRMLGLLHSIHLQPRTVWAWA